MFRNNKKEMNILKHRFQLRDSEFKHLFPPGFNHFKSQELLVEAYHFINNWKKDRTWLLDNGFDLSKFDEETQFKDQLDRLNHYRGKKVLKTVKESDSENQKFKSSSESQIDDLSRSEKYSEESELKSPRPRVSWDIQNSNVKNAPK